MWFKESLGLGQMITSLRLYEFHKGKLHAKLKLDIYLIILVLVER